MKILSIEHTSLHENFILENRDIISNEVVNLYDAFSKSEIVNKRGVFKEMNIVCDKRIAVKYFEEDGNDSMTITPIFLKKVFGTDFINQKQVAILKMVFCHFTGKKRISFILYI